MAWISNDAHGLARDQVTEGFKHVFKGTRNDDDLVGTEDNDLFYLDRGGNDSVRAGAGDDFVVMGGALTARDRINGGSGIDTISLGAADIHVVLGEKTFRNVESVYMAGPYTFYVQLPATMDTHGAFTLNGGAIGETLEVDGTRLSGTSLTILGSSHDDILVGSVSDDLLYGGSGIDILDGGAGRDSYQYQWEGESVSGAYDTIRSFEHGVDRILLSTLDADAGSPGDQAFVFGGQAGHAGSLTVRFDALNDVTFVEGFTNDDAAPDLVIGLAGNHTDLAASDFAL